MTTSIMPTYNRAAITFTHGEGAWLWDKNNQRYLDAIAGIGVCNLGHAHPKIHAAICQQSKQLIHTSNLYTIATQEQLADSLITKSGMTNVFFSNSGAEANEAAIKIARAYGHQNGIENPLIIVMLQSFHGRTMATLSATGNPKVKQGFAPLVSGFLQIPFNDTDALQTAIVQNPNCVAVLLEPIQGEGGVNIPAADYLTKVRAICDQHKILMMLDEIQTGVGRTGEFLAYQHQKIIPDVCTMAKALANGVPIGACLAHNTAASVLTAGMHGSTFGGNPLACSAALAVLNTLEQENIIANVAAKGAYICQQIQEKLSNNQHVLNIRHQGLMIGIDLSVACTELVVIAAAKGLLINVTNDKTIRLLPPLIINSVQMDFLVETLSALIQKYTQQLAIT